MYPNTWKYRISYMLMTLRIYYIKYHLITSTVHLRMNMVEFLFNVSIRELTSKSKMQNVCERTRGKGESQIECKLVFINKMLEM